MSRTTRLHKAISGGCRGIKRGPTFAGDTARRKSNKVIQNLVLKEIEEQEDPVTGKLKRGTLQSILAAYQATHSWLTIAMIDGKRKRMKQKDRMNEENNKKQKPNNRQSFIPKPLLNDTNCNVEENDPDIFDTFVNDLHKGSTIVHTTPLDQDLEEAMFNAFTDNLAIAQLHPVQNENSGRPSRPVSSTITEKSI